MEKREVVITLLNRRFPVLVTQTEEENLQAAGELVRARLENYADKFHINDNLSLVLMCCLDIAAEFTQAKQEHQQFQTYLANEITELNVLLDSAGNSSSA